MRWKDGYSAHVESYLIVRNDRYPLAKINGETLTLDVDCELGPNTTASLVVMVDGDPWTQTVVLSDGVVPGKRKVRYRVEAPF